MDLQIGSASLVFTVSVTLDFNFRSLQWGNVLRQLRHQRSSYASYTSETCAVTSPYGDYISVEMRFCVLTVPAFAINRRTRRSGSIGRAPACSLSMPTWAQSILAKWASATKRIPYMLICLRYAIACVCISLQQNVQFRWR